MTTDQPSITCPRCDRTSYNQNDIESKYCGNCHQYHHLLADNARRLVCAQCGETLGFEVPPGEEVRAGSEYPTRQVDVRCTAHTRSDRR